TGICAADAIGQLPGELADRGLQYMGFSEQIWQAIHNKRAWRGELINRHKAGHLYHEEMSISPVPNKQGEVTHFVVVTQNITARKEMERDLQYSREAVQRLLDSMEEGVYEIDALGNCIFVNRAFLQLLGYQDAAELTGKHIHELIHHHRPDGSPYPKNECRINRIFLDQQPVNVADEVFWRKDGTALPVEYWTHPIEMDGVVTGAITTFVDITERVRMTGLLLEQNRQLLDYSERVKEEEDTAREFIKRFSALDKITDPLVQFILRPAENFSGDMIAVARAPDNRLHVLLADSAGHGLTAALAVIPITQPFYQMTAKGFDIPTIAAEINRRVRDYLQLPRYVACVMLSLDTETQTLQVWNGG
ncbi:MAG: PAS domain S-box protein, partial [Planctomycetota bacterium]